MQPSSMSRTSDAFGRYYTDQLIANLLVNSVASTNPNLIIDLGSGDGVLIEEAKKQWRQSVFVSADIDAQAMKGSILGSVGITARHHIVDVLENGIDEKIGVDFRSVDVALCNPPYIRPRWQKHFADILEDAGLSNLIPKIGSVSAEVLFIAQNLRFLRANGKLGLILPDGIISGEKFQGLRRVLTNSHCVERVIELPRGIFRKTDAKAHILVLSKGANPQDLIKVQCVDSQGILSTEIMLSTEEAAKRIDYSYLATLGPTRQNKTFPTLKEYTIFAKRGSISSSERKKCIFPVFHTTDFTPDTKKISNSFLITKTVAQMAGGVVAQSGDILIARVGRNFSKKISFVPRAHVIVSDCVIIIRVVKEHREFIRKFLFSRSGQMALESISHGVGAKFITIEGLLGLRLKFEVNTD